jgi:hypothetical protein
LAESFHADAATLSVEVSLVELKRNLGSPQAEEAFLAVLQARPPATLQEIEEAGGLPIGRRPPDELMPQIRERFRSGLRTLADRMPDTFDPFAGGPDIGVGRATTALTEKQETLLRIESWARWSPAVPVLLLLLIALFAVRSLRGLLLWWGVPCFLAGLVAALLALPVVPMTRWVFAVVVVPCIPPDAPSALIQAVFGVMTAVVQEVMRAALISATFLAGGGLLCLLLARFCRRRGAQAVAAPTPGP